MKIKKILLISIFVFFISFFAFYNNFLEAANFSTDPAKWEKVETGILKTDTLNPPDARKEHTAVYSNFGGKKELIIFGGTTSKGRENDVQILDLDTKIWKPLAVAGVAPAKRYQHTAVYDNITDTMIIFGGLQDTASKDIWALTNLHTNPRWIEKTKPTDSMLGFGLRYSSAVWTGSEMIIYGGLADDARISNNVYIYNYLNNSWRDFKPGGAPTRYDHSAILDSSGNMVVFGGRDAGHVLRNDVLVLENAISSTEGVSRWTTKIPGNAPSSRAGMSAFYDPQGLHGSMVIIGGQTANSFENDVWVLPKTAWGTEWQQITPITSSPPPGRTKYAGAYDNNGNIIIFGGFNGSLLNDTYKLKFIYKPIAPTIQSISSFCAGNSASANDIVFTDNSDNEDGFNIYRNDTSFNNSAVETDGVNIGSYFLTDTIPTTGNSIRISDTTAQQGKKYYYRVVAVTGTASVGISSEMIIEQTKYCGPSASSPTLSPSTAYKDSTLTGGFTGANFDGTSSTKNYSFNKNNGAWSNWSTTDTYNCVVNSCAVNDTIYFKGRAFDGAQYAETSPISKTISNKAPVANAGNDQTVKEGDIVTLNGSASNDPDGHTPLTYSWTQTGGTPTIVLNSTANQNPIFTAPAVGINGTTLTFALSVNDNLGLVSASNDSVSITINDLPADKILTITLPVGGRVSGTGISCGNDGTTNGTDCNETYLHNTSVELTATPNVGAGYKDGSWIGSCGTGPSNSKCTLTMDTDKNSSVSFAAPSAKTLTVTKSGDGSGAITSNPTGISCGIDCSESYSHGTSVTLTASPTSGHTFIGWNGGGCSGTGNCAITMNANKSVEASFSAPPSNQPTFRISPTQAYLYPNFSSQQYDAYFDEDGSLGPKTETNTADGTLNNSKITWISSNTSIAVIDGFLRTASGKNPGNVVISARYINSSSGIDITATANLTIHPNPKLTVQTDGTGQGVITANKNGITTAGDFANIQCGSGFSNCSEIYAYGTVVRITEAPNENSTFAGWSGDCGGVVSFYDVSMTSDNGNAGESIPTANNDCTATFNLKSFTPSNSPPIAFSQSISIGKNTSVDITLTGSDPDNDSITYILTLNPTHGTLSGTAPNLTYTPNANYWGEDSFNFKVNDGKIDSDAVQIHIAISDTTCNVSDHLPIEPGSPTPSNNATEITPSQILDLNWSDSWDTDIATCGDSIKYDVYASSPANPGGLDTTPYNSADPTQNRIGLQIASSEFYMDARLLSTNYYWQIVAEDLGGNRTTGPVWNFTTASIPQQPNNSPTADSQSVTTKPNTSVSITLTGSDPDNDPLTYIIIPKDFFNGPFNGTLSGTAPNLTYTPNANYVGNDFFRFRIEDGKDDSNIADVNIQVVTPNFSLSQSPFFQVSNPEESNLYLITAEAFDSFDYTINLSNNPNYDTLKNNGWKIGFKNYNSFLSKCIGAQIRETIDLTSVSKTACFYAIPNNNEQNRGKTFTFTIEGSAAPTTQTTNVQLRINQIPVPQGSANPASGNSPLTVSFRDTGSFDPDKNKFPAAPGRTITMWVADLDYADSNGNIITDPENSSGVDYCFSVPDGKCATAFGSGFIKSDPRLTDWTFTYAQNTKVKYCVVDDLDTLNCVFTDITITAPQNTAPVANNQTITVAENSADNSIILTGSDAENDILAFTVLTQPTLGTLNGTAPNLLTYTPNQNTNGADSFTFKVNDGKADSNIANVSITITPAPIIGNQAPVAEASIVVNGTRYSFNNPLTVEKGEQITITSFDADIDVNGDPKASYDPDGWTDPAKGVSSGGGRCEWDYDFDGTYDNPPITNPASPNDCNAGPKNKIFNTVGENQEFTILKITDRGGLSGESKIKVTVTEPCINDCSIGDTQCVNNTSFVDCGHFDDALPGGDNCLDFNSNSTSCGANETCAQNGNIAECKLLPIITFSANPPEIKKEESSNISWNVQNVDDNDCVGESNPMYLNWSNNIKTATGNENVTLVQTTAFTLTCVNSAGPTSKTVNVRVLTVPDPGEF